MRREIWHLTEGLIFAHFAVFLLTSTSPDRAEALAFQPHLLLARPWTAVTFQFLHSGMLSFFFSMLVLWIMGRTLEESWGSARFLLFWAVSVAGAVVTAFFLGQPLASDVFLATSLLFTYATLNPDIEFLLFFVIPVKVKWLAVVAGAFLLFSSLGLGLLAAVANAVGMSAGYVFFLATRRLPSRRRLAFELKQRQAVRQVKAESSVGEERNRAWDGQVRAAVERARTRGAVDAEGEALLAVLDAAVDPSVTVCAPADFGYRPDPVCRACSGYAECAARRIRLAGKGEA